jgi:hypothetical protein
MVIFVHVFLIVMNISQNPLKAPKGKYVFRAKQISWRQGMLDIGTIVTAAIVVASPFIFMGYVRFLVRRAEAHAVGHTSHE